MKKSVLWGQVVVKAIITLIVVLFIIQVWVQIKEGFEPIKQILNPELLDAGIKARYDELQGQDKEALDSMRALLYSVNRIAWFDTHLHEESNWWGWEDFEDINIPEALESQWYIYNDGTLVTSDSPPAGYDVIGSYKDFGRKYGATSAIPTIMDTNLIIYRTDSRNVLLTQMAKDMVDCLSMFRDLQANVRCFAGDFASIPDDMSITADDIKDGFKLLKDDEDMCDDACQSTLNDLTGGSWWDFWNVANWRFEVIGDEITSDNNRYNNNYIRICGDSGGSIFTLDRIYITDNVERCKTPMDALIFTMLVKDFNLPQETSSNIFARLINLNGEPKYITYYEKFPEGEDTAWSYNSYKELGTFITIEALLFGVQMIPVVGKPLKLLLSTPGLKLFLGALIARISTVLTSQTFVSTITNVGALVDTLAEGAGQIADQIMGNAGELSEENIHSQDVKNFLIARYGGAAFFDSPAYRMAVEDYWQGDDDDTYETIGLVLSLARRLQQSYGNKLDEFFSRTVLEDMSLSADFRNALVAEFRTVLSESSIDAAFATDLTSALSDYIAFEYDNNDWLFRTAAGANDNLVNLNSLEQEDSEFRKNEVLGIVLANEQMSGARRDEDFRDYEERRETALRMMLDEQQHNRLLLQKLGVSTTSDMDTLATRLLAGVTIDALPIIADVSGVSRDRLLLSQEILIKELKDSNVAEKNYFLGTNAIGFKTPYKASISYDDRWTKSWVWPNDKDRYLDYLGHYGGLWEPLDEDQAGPADDDSKYYTQRYFGLLPEVNRYFLSMVRDKVWYWWDQPNIRFHLVSPCKANVLVRITQCECYGEPTPGYITNVPVLRLFSGAAQYETGQYNTDYDLTVPNFDGENPMLYSIDPESGQLVKNCAPKKLGDRLPWSGNVYTPTCIEFDPVLERNMGANYCYRGIKPLHLMYADLTLNWVLPITTGVVVGAGGGLTTGVGVIGGPLAAAIAGVVGSIIYTPMEQVCYTWPTHGSTIFCSME